MRSAGLKLYLHRKLYKDIIVTRTTFGRLLDNSFFSTQPIYTTYFGNDALWKLFYFIRLAILVSLIVNGKMDVRWTRMRVVQPSVYTGTSSVWSFSNDNKQVSGIASCFGSSCRYVCNLCQSHYDRYRKNYNQINCCWNIVVTCVTPYFHFR